MHTYACVEKRPLPFKPNELYRGLFISAGSIVPITAIQFAATSVYSDALLEKYICTYILYVYTMYIYI